MKQTILFTILITLFVEIVLAVSGGFLVYKYYDKLTINKSGTSDKIIQKELKELSFEEIRSNTGNIYYDGTFGKIDFTKSEISNGKVYSKEESISYNIKIDEINRKIILKTLAENDLLDKYLYAFLKNSENLSKDYNDILTFINLLGITKKSLLDKLQDDINKREDQVQKNLLPLMKTDNYKELSNYFFTLENDLNIEISYLLDNLFVQNNVLNDENFQYIISKLFSDDYYKNIKNTSLATGVDEKLIMSAIGIEQLRYLTTDRGYAKNLIKQNKLLTNFNKFSYGLGGIKINTFKQINADLKELDLDFYNKNFQQYDEIVKIDGTYLDSDIQKILEDNYLGILYSAGLLYAIQKKREVAGYSINDKPGIIITLYNFGNEKKPHSNPEVGGSSIRLNDEYTYYFGELGFLMYYYIKWYL